MQIGSFFEAHPLTFYVSLHVAKTLVLSTMTTTLVLVSMSMSMRAVMVVVLVSIVVVVVVMMCATCDIAFFVDSSVFDSI